MREKMSLSISAILLVSFIAPLLHAAPPEINKDQIQSCITSLCGDASVNVSNSFVNENIGSVSSREAVAMSKVLGDEIQSLVKEQIQVEKDKVRALETALKDPSPVHFTEKVKELMVLMTVVKDMVSKTDVLFVFGGESGAVEKKGGFDIYTSGMSPAAKSAARIILDKVTLPAAVLAVKASIGGSAAISYHLKKNYPTLELREALALDARLLAAKGEKIIKYFDGVLGETAGLEINDVLLSQAMNQQDLNASEMDQYMEMYIEVTMISGVLDQNIASALRKHPLKLESKFFEFRNGDYLKNKLQEIALVDSLNLDHKVRATCSVYMRYSFDGNTSNLRIRKFQPIVMEVKKSGRNCSSKNG